MADERVNQTKKTGPLALAKRTLTEFVEDDCPRLAAALSYYTVFSLPPILVLLLMIVDAFTDPEQARAMITSEVGGVLGSDAAGQIETMIASASDVSGNWFTTVLSIGALTFAATGALSQLQRALNKAWSVEFDPRAEGVKKIAFVIGKRLFSLAMVVVVAFLLLVSLVLSAGIRAFSEEIAPYLPVFGSQHVMLAANMAMQLLMFTLLFAAMFRILPDARVSWRHVWVGSFATALLFMIGMQLISIYIGQSEPGSAFGAAGALAIILVWVYMCAMILFLGAEFTQVWAQRRGGEIEPSRYAVKVRRAEQVRRDRAAT